MACCVNPVQGTNKIGSIGVPLPDVEVRIVDAEDPERVMPAGEVGEMMLRAPQHMVEYWNNPLETARDAATHMARRARGCTPATSRYMDDDGYIFIVDRKKDMLKTSGFQVWPREIEEVLAAHPAVMEVGVAGVPDAVKGEVAKAWVVLKAGQHGHRGGAARVLPRAARAVQSAGARRVPDGAAEDDGREGPAAGAGGRRRPRSDRSQTDSGYPTDRTLHFDVRGLERLRGSAPRASAAPGVSPCTQIVSTSSDTRAVDRDDCAIASHRDRAFTTARIVDHGARLAARHQRAVGAIGAIGKRLARGAQPARVAAAIKLRARKTEQDQRRIDCSDRARDRVGERADRGQPC